MSSRAQTASPDRAIALFYGFQFFFPMLLWVPIFYEYQRRFGLSDPQIFFIQSLYYVTFCLAELPTGLIADRWGYRLCLRLGAAMLVVANLLPVLTPTYPGFFFHFTLVALSRSFVSGAASAWLYDYLAKLGEVRRYKQIEGSSRAYGLVGKVVCWAGIGALMAWHVTLPYWLSALTAVLSLGFAWALPPIPGGAGPASAEALPLRDRLSGVLGILRGYPFLVFLMLQGIAIFTLSRIGTDTLFQPILQSKTFDLAWYGILMSGITVFEAIGAARFAWIQRWLDDLNAVFVITVAMALSLAMIPFSGQIGTALWLCVFSWLIGVSYPIQRQLLNDAIPDSRFRATLLSTESIIDRAVCAVVAAQMGGFLQRGQLDQFLWLSAAGTLATMAILYAGMRRRRQLAAA